MAAGARPAGDLVSAIGGPIPTKHSAGELCFAFVELAFRNKELRAICESQLKAEGELGMEVAAKLRARLADLRDASSILDVVAGNPRPRGDNATEMLIDLSDGVQLVLMANHAANPTKGEKVDWRRVRRVQITNIGAVDE